MYVVCNHLFTHFDSYLLCSHQMQAFSMEMSSLDETLTKLQENIEAMDNQSIMKKCVENCNSSVQVLQDTCSFMNATINRCLDYCKATVGMVLCPLHEPVHLEEAMYWVVNCVNRTQEGQVLDISYLSKALFLMTYIIQIAIC